MMKKIEMIRERIRIRKKMLAKGYSTEEIKLFLTEKGYYNEETRDIVKIPVKIGERAYCRQCKMWVKILNPTVTKREIKKNSYRRFLGGYCAECGRKVSQILGKVEELRS